VAKLATLIIFAILTVGSGATSTADAADDQGANLGRFGGTIWYDGLLAVASLDLSATPTGLINYSSYETSDRIPLENVRVHGEAVSFEMTPEVGGLTGRIAFTGKLDGDRLAGSYRAGKKTGRFDLMRLTSVPAESLSRYFGLYRAGNGHHMGIFDGGGPAAIVNYDTGVVRSLRPTDGHTFVGGPGLWAYFPAEMTIAFEAGQGPAESFKIQVKGEAPQIARRVHFKEEKVTFRNAGIDFAGTLITPDGPGKHAVVIVVPGDYGSTRDFMRLFGQNFLVAGLGVLLYDGRGGGESGGVAQSTSFPDLADDVISAVHMLQGKPQVDPKRIGLFGFSNSTWTTVQAASKSNDIAFIVNHSAVAMQPWQQEVSRVELFAKGEGLPAREVEQAVRLMRAKFEVGRTGKGWDAYQAEVTAAGNARWVPYLNPPRSLESLQKSSPRMAFDPIPAYKALSCPALFIWGANDVYLPAEENLNRVRSALSPKQLERTELVLLRDTDHSMMEVKTRALREGNMVKHYAPAYWPTIRDWVRKTTSTP
jgi:dienelactone hydrolase